MVDVKKMKLSEEIKKDITDIQKLGGYKPQYTHGSLSALQFLLPKVKALEKTIEQYEFQLRDKNID